MVESTEDLELAKEWAQDLFGDKNVARYYLSPEKFIAAYKGAESFSFIIQGQPFYGHLYGASAYLDPRLTSVAIEGEQTPSPQGFTAGGSFQIWQAKTVAGAAPIELLTGAASIDEINVLITEHAPDSSVRPGDNEEVFWGGIRNDLGELIASAVLVKWQSGLHVISSVVVRTQDRGQGLATELSKGILTEVHSRGVDYVGLGVRADNFAAQRAYQKAGFEMIGAFTNYSRE